MTNILGILAKHYKSHERMMRHSAEEIIHSQTIRFLLIFKFKHRTSFFMNQLIQRHVIFLLKSYEHVRPFDSIFYTPLWP